MLSCLIHVPFFVTLWTVNPPGSTVHGILQAGILEWLPCPPPGDLPDPGIEPESLHWQTGFFTASATWEAQNVPLALLI